MSDKQIVGVDPLLQPIEERFEQTSWSAVEQVQIAPPSQEKPHEAGSANLAIVIGYKGEARTTELTLTHDRVRQLALEAQFRDMSIGELVDVVITATLKQDLFQLMLGTEGPIKERQTLILKGIRVFPGQPIR